MSTATTHPLTPLVPYEYHHPIVTSAGHRIYRITPKEGV